MSVIIITTVNIHHDHNKLSIVGDAKQQLAQREPTMEGGIQNTQKRDKHTNTRSTIIYT